MAPKCLALKASSSPTSSAPAAPVEDRSVQLLRLSMDIWNIAREPEETLVTADVKGCQIHYLAHDPDLRSKGKIQFLFET